MNRLQFLGTTILGFFKPPTPKEPEIKYMKRVNDTLIELLDSHTNEYVTFSKVTKYADGSAMNDAKCDGVIYRKLGNEYFKRNIIDTINVKSFGAKGDGNLNPLSSIYSTISEAKKVYPFVTSLSQSLDWAATQKAVITAILYYSRDRLGEPSNGVLLYDPKNEGVPVGASPGGASPYMSIIFPKGTYVFSEAVSMGVDGISNPVDINKYLYNINFCFMGEHEDGVNISGVGENNLFYFFNSGFRNKFKNINFCNYGTGIIYKTSNKDTSHFHMSNCQSNAGNTLIDTYSYQTTRSTIMILESIICCNTKRLVNSFVDKLVIRDSWIYNKFNSEDALLRISGDCNFSCEDCFFIPLFHDHDIVNPDNSRWIDIVNEPENSTPNDRSLKTINIKNSRCSLESARPFIWFFDKNAGLLGPNQHTSITIEDCYLGGTGGRPVITLKEGYPGSISLRNCKVFSSPEIVSLDLNNPNPPLPSVPGAITNFVIMVDEATRLTQQYDTSRIIDSKLESFYYDTTSQTSKFKRSIHKNIDYRLRSVASSPGKVKVSLPIFFDSSPEVPNRDILTLLVTVVGDSGGGLPVYNNSATVIISIVGGYESGAFYKRITVASIQDAKGGISFDKSCMPNVYWGEGDTGSQDISPENEGSEKKITIQWASSNFNVSWAYIMPLAGLRENQKDKEQYYNW